MRIKRRRGFASLLAIGLAFLVGMAVLPTTAHAGFVKYFDSGNTELVVPSVTLGDLLGGDYILINNGFDTKKFSDFGGFSSAATGTHGTTAIDPSTISVKGDDGTIVGALDPGPGLIYQGLFKAFGGDTQDTKFSYDVAVLGPSSMRIHDHWVNVGAASISNSNGEIDIIESASSPVGTPVGDTTLVRVKPPGTSVTTDQVFYNPVTFVHIDKDIFLMGGTPAGVPGGAPKFTSFTDMTQRFSQVAVPEPSSMALAGLGALSMIGYGIRRRKGA